MLSSSELLGRVVQGFPQQLTSGTCHGVVDHKQMDVS